MIKSRNKYTYTIWHTPGVNVLRHMCPIMQRNATTSGGVTTVTIDADDKGRLERELLSLPEVTNFANQIGDRDKPGTLARARKTPEDRVKAWRSIGAVADDFSSDKTP